MAVLLKPDKYFPKWMIERPSGWTAVRRYIGQVFFAVLFMAFIGYFSSRPTYHQVGPNMALIKLSIAHPGQRAGECHERTAEELAKLAPNMRSKTVCARERVPVYMEMLVDGKVIFKRAEGPKGLSKDGPSVFYAKVFVEAGPHDLAVRLRDSKRTEGFDYVKEAHLELVAGQNLVVTFRHDSGGLQFR